MQEKTNPVLNYPLTNSPEIGKTVEVAPGIHWLRLPVPFELNHINVWLLEDEDAYTLVDTGIYSRESCVVWEQVLENKLEGKPLKRIIVTHFHPDHFGLAGWLCKYTNAEYFSSRETVERVSFLLDEEDKQYIDSRQAFYRQHEIKNTDFFEDFLKGSLYAAVVSGKPSVAGLIHDGDLLKIGKHSWKAIMTYGHAPGHINLYCEELSLLISGDQVLPTITSNVSVHADQPEANPLQEYLESFDKLLGLPEDTIVLPSHGKVFEGLQARILEVREDHYDKLEKVHAICQKAHTASELLPKLFRPDLEGINSVLAFGETLAHLNYLCEEGKLQRNLQAGKYIYQQ